MNILLLSCLVTLAACAAVQAHGFGVSPYVYPVVPPQSGLWNGYPWVHSAYRSSLPKSSASYAPLCGVLNGAFKTFPNANEFLLSVRHGYDFKFYCNGPCPQIQTPCSDIAPICAFDGVLSKTFMNSCVLAKENLAAGKHWIQVSQGACPSESGQVSSTTTATPIITPTAPSVPTEASDSSAPAESTPESTSSESITDISVPSESAAESSTPSDIIVITEDTPASSAPAESTPVSTSTSESIPIPTSLPESTPSESTTNTSSEPTPPNTSSEPTPPNTSSEPTPSSTASSTTTTANSLPSSTESVSDLESQKIDEALLFIEDLSQMVDVGALNEIETIPPEEVTEESSEPATTPQPAANSPTISPLAILAALLKPQSQWPAGAAISYRNNVGNSYDIYAEGNVYNHAGIPQQSPTTGLSQLIAYLANL